ncbi:CvpA family protein [Cytophagaceae bacterium DM2B3-1]|uniref:CvpA family protein n=1 Tax=Xanthocytophaga flava TaxID=3048013 RepID=A0ABT7CE04_9BACT|nr:CvpA family protein [Xanthocytophaga flavus]MDJ1473129.1 CvpA family protein [Xanthocytophaga flavus]MDJ1491974.1 CvpA family protein [Xanthocytophaga flavus]
MKTLDIVLLVPLIWGAYNGYKKGLLMSFVAIAAFVIAVVLGFRLLHAGIEWLAPYLSGVPRRILPYIGFSTLFFPIIFLVTKLGQMLRNAWKYTLIGSFDSIAGAIVGLTLWAFGASVVIWLITAIGIRIPADAREHTFVYPVVEPIAPIVINKASGLLPAGENLLQRLKKRIDEA